MVLEITVEQSDTGIQKKIKHLMQNLLPKIFTAILYKQRLLLKHRAADINVLVTEVITKLSPQPNIGRDTSVI